MYFRIFYTSRTGDESGGYNEEISPGHTFFRVPTLQSQPISRPFPDLITKKSRPKK
jgi:hypothetical protein